MTALAFVVVFLAAFGWFSIVGTPLLWSGGMTIYTASMFSVLLVCASSAIAHFRDTRETAQLWASSILALVIIVGCSFPWTYAPIIRMYENLAFGAAFLWIGTRIWQYLLGSLFLTGSLISVLALMGAFPARPRVVFTGFYYLDIVAYLTYAMLITVGLASNDTGYLRRVFVASGTRLGLRYHNGFSGRMARPPQAHVALDDRSQGIPRDS